MSLYVCPIYVEEEIWESSPHQDSTNKYDGSSNKCNTEENIYNGNTHKYIGNTHKYNENTNRNYANVNMSGERWKCKYGILVRSDKISPKLSPRILRKIIDCVKIQKVVTGQ